MEELHIPSRAQANWKSTRDGKFKIWTGHAVLHSQVFGILPAWMTPFSGPLLSLFAYPDDSLVD